MKRYLFNLAAALSLVLCVATIALWIRSYKAAEHFWYNFDGGAIMFRTDSGDFTFRRSKVTDRYLPGPESARFVYRVGQLVGSRRNRDWNWGPFTYGASKPPPPLTPEQVQGLRNHLDEYRRAKESLTSADPREQQRLVQLQDRALGAIDRLSGRLWSWRFVFPAWLLVLLTMVLPLLAGWRWGRDWKRRRRARQGFCLVCGYDLRATPQRCPECGTAATEGA